MAINFNIGDILVAKQAYNRNTIANAPIMYNGASRANNVRRTVTLLGSLGSDPVEVIDTGTMVATLGDGVTQVVRSYVRVVPLNKQSAVYNNGRGVAIFWESDVVINNMFELSTAYVVDTQSKRALNLTASTIPKGYLVRVVGFDIASQLPTIEIANAASSNTAPVFGITEEAILSNSVGSVLVEGHYQGLDTSAFSINDVVYLSDTPGQISTTEGSSPQVIGRVINVGSSDGSIAIKGIMPLGGSGGGAGAQGATGIQGGTGIQGQTGVRGIQGIQGITGVGTTGVTGETGVRGLTGIQGLAGMGTTGVGGITGLTGQTGIQGVTGVQGFTGVGAGTATELFRDTFTGSVSDNQTAFVLSQAPNAESLVAFEINGVVYRSTIYFTVSGTTLTWTDVFQIVSTDEIIAIYT